MERVMTSSTQARMMSQSPQKEKSPRKKPTMTRQGIIEPRLSSPATIIPGVGGKKSQALEKLGVFTLEDMLYFMPFRYEDRRFPKPLCDLKPGKTEGAIAYVQDIVKRGNQTEAVIFDDTGTARVRWFTDKIAGFVREGMRLAVYGQISNYYIEPQFTHPEFEILAVNQPPTIIGIVLPIYPANSDLTQRILRKFVNTALNDYAEKCLQEFLPSRILQRYGMMSLCEAVRQVHNPDDEKKFIRARNRLSFDELFLLQAGVMMRRKSYASKYHAKHLTPGKLFTLFTENLPFTMTDAQLNATHEILSDMAGDMPMNRLLQGDVGSGKTLVAECAMIAACDSGVQSAFMAPTEILAQQHYMTLTKSLAPLGINIALLTGSLKASERRKILDGLADGSIHIAVGTHALFSENVKFHDLALVIADEQHRFGVMQRVKLAEKGTAPHVLAMTATPIPRTLVMSIYGGLEVSTINELPPGRKPVRTISLTPPEYSRVYDMIREQVHEGRQAYWVCPLIEESDDNDLHSVKEAYDNLRGIMPELRISFIHGRLSPDEKAGIMHEFSSGKIDVLVCTVVVEVGVDVPNASMIVIQDAGQFGLSQLHQLRGRVGRGDAESVCVLLENADITPVGHERVSAMVQISDGFELAEVDLIQRGPGEVCGIRQHGVNEFRVADLVRDEKILYLARDEAELTLKDDPELEHEPELRQEIFRRLGGVLELATAS
ncbi:MAG: ATP-dependent DNA helicase RecG [Synergistaceae bacterium]|nr:ATP-dependent DNA helicase RecG [Synergistaceae bacterium]